MPIKRRRIDPALKARIALEALRGRTSIPALAEKYALHPNQIHAWKKQLQDQASLIFDRRLLSLSPRALIEDSVIVRASVPETSLQDVPDRGEPSLAAERERGADGDVTP
jgi:transposase